MYFDIEVTCEKCGDALDAETRNRRGAEDVLIVVTPCEKCMDSAHEEGFDKGFKEGEESVNA